MSGRVVHDDTYTVSLYGRGATDRVIPPPALIEPYVDVVAQRFQRAAIRLCYLTLRDYVNPADARQLVLALLNAGCLSTKSFDAWRRHPQRF